MRATYTLKHLKYFMSVAKHLHFGHAAEECFVTQPTLSAAIKEFEDILGLKLLERTKRRVLITAAGKEVLDHARDICQRADNLMSLAQARGTPLSGNLRLGVIPTIGPYLLPNFMKKVRSEFPDLVLYLREDQTARLLVSLEEGELDLLILALPYDAENIDSFTFMQDPFYCTLPSSHPLARRKVIHNKDLQDENLLLLEEGHCLRDHAMAACSWVAQRNKQEFGATSLSTIVQMVANDIGITLIPQMAIDAGITQGAPLKTIAMGKESPARDIGLVWRKSSARADEFKLLGSYLKSAL